MVNPLKVFTFTPIESDNTITLLPALYLSPLFCGKEIAVVRKPLQISLDGSEGCTRKPMETSCVATAFKIASYILTAGILPLLAILLTLAVRYDNKFHYIVEEPQREHNLFGIPSQDRVDRAAGVLPSRFSAQEVLPKTGTLTQMPLEVEETEIEEMPDPYDEEDTLLSPREIEEILGLDKENTFPSPLGREAPTERVVSNGMGTLPAQLEQPDGLPTNLIVGNNPDNSQLGDPFPQLFNDAVLHAPPPPAVVNQGPSDLELLQVIRELGVENGPEILAYIRRDNRSAAIPKNEAVLTAREAALEPVSLKNLEIEAKRLFGQYRLTIVDDNLEAILNTICKKRASPAPAPAPIEGPTDAEFLTLFQDLGMDERDAQIVLAHMRCREHKRVEYQANYEAALERVSLEKLNHMAKRGLDLRNQRVEHVVGDEQEVIFNLICKRRAAAKA